MPSISICPKCGQANAVEDLYCRNCKSSMVGAEIVQEAGKSEAPTPSPTAESHPGKRRGRGCSWLTVAVLGVILVIIYLTMGVYTVQPIGALPEGATVIVWRGSGEPFFNSPDAMCLKRVGYVSLLCRGMAMGQAPIDRIILRLPYIHLAYLASTGGKEFDR